MIETVLCVGIGGFFGTCCRYLIVEGAKRLFGSGYPAGTFIVNTLGCYVAGILLTLSARGLISPVLSMLLVVGLCGGVTTFSSFVWDMYSLLCGRKWKKFVYYFISTLLFGFLGLFLGLITIG